jgi:choline dehydrogenase-like flavoprotein
MATEYDVIIIGTGAGGGTLARHLAPSGKRILLLERAAGSRGAGELSAEEVFVKNRRLRGDVVRPARQGLQPGVHYGGRPDDGAALYRLRRENSGASTTTALARLAHHL